jgi:hypothetical protein
MGGICGTHGISQKCIEHLIWKPERKIPHGRLKHTRKDTVHVFSYGLLEEHVNKKRLGKRLSWQRIRLNNRRTVGSGVLFVVCSEAK